jgi:hypothetical protein
VETNSTGGQGSRRAVAPSDDDENIGIVIYVYTYAGLINSIKMTINK